MGELINAYGVIRKPEGNSSLRIPSLGWENIIKMGVKEIGCEGRDCICLPQIQWRVLVNLILNIRVT
jgi:hypothetical protein